MTTESVPCPDCRGLAKQLGAISATDTFAGRRLDKPLAGGSLYRCLHCSLGFRWPRLSKGELDALYAQGSDFTWAEAGNARRDWHIARDWIRQSVPKGHRILDVGCFDGGFLAPFVAEYGCSGIEIHPAASQRARQKSIDILGNDFSAVSGSFDVVTAFDVIEHVERPGQFLEDCLAATNRHGYVLISSGNLDAASFRLMGSRYWYCTIGEHVSFVSPRWFLINAAATQYEIVRQATFIHGDARWSRRVRDAGVNLAYRFGGAGFRALRRLGMGGKAVTANPELSEPIALSGSY